MKSSPGETIKLRGHHLICLHFFNGEGYNPEFIVNLNELLKRAEAGVEIDVYSGADDVCRKCPYLKGKICLYDTNAESGIREMDETALKLLNVNERASIAWEGIKKKIPGVLITWSIKYCSKCNWRGVCEKDSDFLLILKQQISRNSSL
jgi:hypothetical protein